MKIAFIRLSAAVELNLSSASINTLGTELRVGLFESLIRQGHTVKVYSGIRSADQKLTKTKSLFDTSSWINKVQYEPLAFPKDEDILLIEQGTDNVRYSYHDGEKETSYIKRTFDCISNWSGPVIYYQHGCLPFPFRTKDASVETILNLRNLNKRSQLFKDKTWTIWHHFTNWDYYLSLKDNPYQPFKDQLSFKFTMLPYSDIEPWYTVKANPKWDSLFIGSQWDSRSTKQGFNREKQIQNLYDKSQLNTAIIGKWNEKDISKFNHTKYLGMLGYHGDAYKYWNDSYTCLYTTSPTIGKAGLLPTRLTMPCRSGSVVLYEDTLDCAKLFPKDWHINSSNVVDKVSSIKSLSPEERDKLRQLQLSKFPKWDEIKMEDLIK